MFRRLPHNLPPDPQFPPDLEKLGFFVNDQDQIRSIKNPEHKYQYKINHNDRVNQTYKQANNSAVRRIVTQRLHALGLETVRLPLGATPTDKHVPIFMSKNIANKDRVIVFFGERSFEPGILAWRVIGETGIKHGSLVEFVTAVNSAPTQLGGGSDQVPAIVIANPCQLLWYRGGGRAVSTLEWEALPRQSAVHDAMRVDKIKNLVQGQEDYRKHVQYLFDHVLATQLKTNVKLDIIGCEYTGSAAVEHLAEHWEKWSDRVTGICLVNPQHEIQDLIQQGASPKFVDFISKRSRAYFVSNLPLEKPVAGRDLYGCNCYSSGEDSYQENAIVRSWGSMLDWFDILHKNPEFEEIEFIYVNNEEDKVELGWPAEITQENGTENEIETKPEENA